MFSSMRVSWSKMTVSASAETDVSSISTGASAVGKTVKEGKLNNVRSLPSTSASNDGSAEKETGRSVAISPKSDQRGFRFVSADDHVAHVRSHVDARKDEGLDIYPKVRRQVTGGEQFDILPDQIVRRLLVVDGPERRDILRLVHIDREIIGEKILPILRIDLSGDLFELPVRSIGVDLLLQGRQQRLHIGLLRLLSVAAGKPFHVDRLRAVRQPVRQPDIGFGQDSVEIPLFVHDVRDGDPQRHQRAGEDRVFVSDADVVRIDVRQIVVVVDT